MNFKKSIFLTVSVLSLNALDAQSSGQNYTISPYSNFGLGEILNLNIAEAGNSTQTYSGAYSYSFFNPATLANLKFTTFDFGMNYRYGLIETNTAARSYRGGGLSYLSLAFRSLHKNIIQYKDSAGLKKKSGHKPLNWNSYLSIYPGTSVGYNYTLENTVPFLTRTAHSGKGGVNAFEFSNSFSYGKHLSLGYSAAYLFGQISDRSVFSAPDSADLFILDDDRSLTIRGYRHQAGFMYQFKMDSTYHRFGASYRVYSGVKAANRRLTHIYGYTNGVLTSADTIFVEGGNFQGLSMPGGFGLGYSFQWRKKWSVALDYYNEKWSNYEAFFQSSQKLSNRSDYGLTFVLNPLDEKQGKTRKMPIPVRLGARYTETQNVVKSTSGERINIDEKSAFIGFGIPVTRRYYDNQVLRSMINVRFDYTTRGSLRPGLAKEQYFITTLSFNMGDIWFQRRKFD